MSSGHLVLIVEDDPETATDLAQLATSMGCESTQTDNYRDAFRFLRERRFCIILLDLEIRENPDSIRGHKVFGAKLIQEVRKRYGGNRGSPFWTPVVVITAHAKQVDAAVRMMRDGADDIISKPLDLADVETRIRSVLQLAGRHSHLACATAESRAAEKERLVLRITGERERERCIVTVANRAVPLTISALRVLLHLALARQKGQMVSSQVLGARPYEGFRQISRLREQLRTAGRHVDIVANDRHGGYALKGEVVVAACDAEALKTLHDTEIDRLAAELLALLTQQDGELGRRV